VSPAESANIGTQRDGRRHSGQMLVGWSMWINGLRRLLRGPRLRSFWPRTRVRRALDVFRLILAGGALIGLIVLAIQKPAAVQWLATAIPQVQPGVLRTLLSILNIAVSTSVFALLVLITIDALRFRRFAFTSGVLAGALGLLTGFSIALLLASTQSQTVALLAPPPSQSPGLTLTVAVAVVAGADLTRRRLGYYARLVLAVAVTCALLLGSLTLPSAAYAVFVGGTVGAAVRVVLGVVPARPSGELIRSVVAAAGWYLIDLTPLVESAGRSRFAGLTSDGTDLHITVVDQDRRGVPLVRRLWRLLLLRSAAVGRPALSLRWQLERQTLCGALAASAGVATPRAVALLAAGPALVLVEEPLVGDRITTATGPSLADRTLAAASALRRVHNVGLALGSVTAESIVLLPDGAAGFADLTAAQPAATELQRELDVVVLLVTLATRIPPADAVAVARAGYGLTPAMETRLAALLQPVALPRQLRRTTRRAKVIPELRAALTADQTDGGVPAAVRLERLRPRTVLTVVAGTVAAYILASQLSQVNLVEALRTSIPGWLALALLGSALTYVGSALIRQAFVPIQLPLGRTMMVQLASSFLSLVTPPTVGHLGINIRYLQRAGVPTAAAAASIAVGEIVVVFGTLALLLVCLWITGTSTTGLSLLPSGPVLAVLIGAAAVIALVVALSPTRRMLRRRLEPLIKRTLPQLIAAATSPRRIVMALGGMLLMNGGYLLAIDASLRAFSASVSFPLLVVVYFAASAVGSAAPTPGGIGAVEAALVAGLTAAGVPVTAALTAVIAYRAATFWLPAPLGWVALVSLQRKGRV
jgi:glycosyltransferase 2 family protein